MASLFDLRALSFYLPTRALRALACLGLLSQLFGCASAPPPAMSLKLVDPMEEKIIALNDRIAIQERKIGKLSATVESLVERTRKAAPAAKPKKDPTEGGPLPVTRLMPPGESEVEETGETTAELEASKAADASALGEETLADSTHEAMHLYYRGTQMMEAKRYDEALTAFREFLKQNPTHVYADRAQSWIGEAHFLNKEYGLVVVATNLLENRHPESFKIPDALFKRALAFESMGQKQPALGVLKDLLKRYPKAPVADMATKKLVELASKDVAASETIRN